MNVSSWHLMCLPQFYEMMGVTRLAVQDKPSPSKPVIPGYDLDYSRVWFEKSLKKMVNGKLEMVNGKLG